MIEIKKTTFLLSLLMILIIGLVLGYFIASTKPVVTKILYLDNDTTETNSNVTIKRNIENVNLTANEAVDISYSEALTWSDDIFLVGITLTPKIFNLQGQSNGWKIKYYSIEKDLTYEMLIKDGESRGGEEKVSKPLQTLKGELVDSTTLAQSFFSSYPEDSKINNLKMYYDENAKKFIWTIFFTGGSHTIDSEN